MSPKKNMDDFCTMLWSGMYGLYWKLSKEGKKRLFDEFLPLLHDTKHDVLGKEDDNSWYLVYIGTKPSSRGKGYAKSLIEYTTKQVCKSISYSQLTQYQNQNLFLFEEKKEKKKKNQRIRIFHLDEGKTKI